MPEVSSQVSIESGPLHASHPRLALCAHCTESLEAWVHRRHRRSSRRGSGDGPSSRASTPPLEFNRDLEYYEKTWDLSSISHILLLAGIFATMVIGAVVYVVYHP